MKTDDLQIVRKLGSGDSSDVFLAEIQGDLYALKVLHPHLAADVLVRQRFVNEGQLLAGIRHQNVVRVHSVEQYEERPAFVMEYLPGGTAEKRRMDKHQAIELISGIAAALSEIHKHGIVHRDVRPEHILFDAGGTPKLADFGAASIRDIMGLTRSTVFTNQPHYVDPYTWGRGSRSPIQDIYGLGAVAYEMLVGAPPNDQLPVRGWLTRENAISRLGEVTEGSIVELVASMLDAPERRPRSAQEVLAWLSFDHATGGRDLTECLYCGSALPAESPICLECHHEPIKIELNPLGRFLALRKISEDQEILSPFLRRLRLLAADPDPQIHLLIGDVRLYSRAEQKSGTRLPVRIADGVAEESVEPLIALLTTGSRGKIRISAHQSPRTGVMFKRGPLITLKSGTATPRASTRSIIDLVTAQSTKTRNDDEARVSAECRYALAIAASRLAEGDVEEWGISEVRLQQVWGTLLKAVDQVSTTRHYLSTLDLPRAYAELEVAGETAASEGTVASSNNSTSRRIVKLFEEYAASERELARISLGVSEACRALESITPANSAETFRLVEQWLRNDSEK